MREYWEQLKAHTNLLGEPNESIETLGSFTATYNRKKEGLQSLLSPFIDDSLKLFGASLDYQLVDIASGNQTIINQDNFQRGLIESLLADLPAASDCKLVVVVDKDKLLKKVFTKTHGQIFLYFQHAYVVERLARDLVTLESDWFSPGQKVFLVLGDYECRLVGEVLHIFGGVSASDLVGFVQAPLTNADQLNLRVGTRAAETHWQDGPRFLLPEYLRVQDKAATADTKIKPRLNQHFLGLTLASLANYTHTQDSALVALFEGQKRFEAKAVNSVGVTNTACDAWFEIYDWVYENRTSDKLAIIRNLVTLQSGGDEAHNYGLLATNGEQLLKSAKDHFERFIAESIEKYFDKLGEAAKYVQSKVDSIGQQVGGLVDTFTKNLLATAGFLIGTVLWKLADPKLAAASPLIVFAFLAYMIVVLAVYYPITFWSYWLTRKEYNHNLALYKRSFTDSDVATFIGGSFGRRSLHFWVAFGLTGLIHVLLLVAACLAYRYAWLQ